MGEFAKSVISNVVADIMIMIVLVIYRATAPALTRRDPWLRPIALLTVGVVWFAANVWYIESGLRGYTYLFLISTAMVAYVVGGELVSFWRVGLVGEEAVPWDFVSKI